MGRQPRPVTGDASMVRDPTSEARRILVAAPVGLAVGIVVGVWEPAQLAVLAGWDVAASLLSAWIWLNVGHLTPDDTAARATREDGSRVATTVVLVTASVIALVGVLLAFVKARHVTGPTAPALNVAGLVAVVSSWFLVHTLFTLRYAHLYYRDRPGGIDFKDDEGHPAYPDFAYVAFTVGMTFQVSDTDIHSADIRRTVLRQALLSYLFGTVIVASTINIIAGLLR